MPVDALEQCNKMVGKDYLSSPTSSPHANNSSHSSQLEEGAKYRKYFPFKQGHLFVATFRVGSEGIQMTVDGRHVTSFAFREVICLLIMSFLFYFEGESRSFIELICAFDN